MNDRNHIFEIAIALLDLCFIFYFVEKGIEGVWGEETRIPIYLGIGSVILLVVFFIFKQRKRIKK